MPFNALGIVTRGGGGTGGGGEPEPTILLEDDFTGTNGAAWNSTNWPFPHGGGITIESNQGQIATSGSWTCSALTVTDFELLVKITSASALAGRFPEIGWRFGTNTGGSGTVANGYLVQVSSSSGGRVDLCNYTSSHSVIATAAATALNAVVTAWFRVRVVGTNHKVRWWLDGAGEPGTWQIDHTDATYATGKLLFRAFSSTAVLYDDLTVTAID